MKRLFIAAPLGAALALAAPARATTYGWDGGGSNNSWQSAANWRSDTIPPLTGSNDIAIKASQLVSPFTVMADWDYSSSTSATYGAVEVVSNSSYAMTLKKSGAGTFAATGALTLTGYSASKPATFRADTDLRVTGINVHSYVTINIASGVTADDDGSLTLDAISGYTECTKTGSGTLTPDTIELDAGDAGGSNPEDAKLIISAGTINAVGGSPTTSLYASSTVNVKSTLRVDGGALDPGTLRLYGGNTADREAIFEFASGSVTNPDEIKMYGHSRIDQDQNLTVVGDLSALVASGSTFATAGLLDVDSTKVLDVNGQLRVDASAGASQLEKLGSGALTPDTIAVNAGGTAGRHATFLISDGNLTVTSTASQATTIAAAATVVANATLQFNGSGDTYTPGDFYLFGGDPDNGGGLALFDFDAGTLANPVTVNMYGLSSIDTEQDFAVDEDFVVTGRSTDDFITRATVDVAVNKTITAGAVEVGADDQRCKLIKTGDGTLITN